MNPLTQRVLERFLVRVADSQGEEDTSKGGVPPRWKEWLDAVHQGGKEKVPNPNPETKEHYRAVAYTTALKDKKFFGKAIQEYYKWLGKNPEKKDPNGTKNKPPEEDKSKGKTKAEPKEKAVPEAPATEGLKGALGVSDEELDEIIKTHAKAFKEIEADMRDEMKHFSKEFSEAVFGMSSAEKPSKTAIKEFEALPEKEKMLLAGGHFIGQLFEKTLSKEERQLHREYTNAWSDSSSSDDSIKIHGALSTMGIRGFQTKEDRAKENFREFRDDGKKNEKLKKYIGKVYAFTQAYYKHLGIEEVTLFRGVVGNGIEDAVIGENVELDTRELSSFTANPSVASQFGTPIRMKVPVAAILWSNLTTPIFTSQKPPSHHRESEVTVMGASYLDGEVFDKPSAKLVEMEDW